MANFYHTPDFAKLQTLLFPVIDFNMICNVFLRTLYFLFVVLYYNTLTRKIIIIIPLLLFVIIIQIIIQIFNVEGPKFGGFNEYIRVRLNVFMCLLNNKKIRQFENRTC